MGCFVITTIGLLFLVAGCATIQTGSTEPQTEPMTEDYVCGQYYYNPENCGPDTVGDCYTARIDKVQKPQFNGTMFVRIEISFRSVYYSNQKAWFGIGINTEPSMNSADTFIVTLDEAHEITSTQKWKVGFYSAGEKASNQNDYTTHQFYIPNAVETYNIVVIERECDTGDSEDINLCDGNFYWLFPYSGGAISSDGTIQKHRETPDIVEAKPLLDCNYYGYTDQKCDLNYSSYPKLEDCYQSDDCYRASITVHRNGGPYNDTVEMAVQINLPNTDQRSWFGIAFNTKPTMRGAIAILGRTDEKGYIFDGFEKWKLGFYSIGDKDSLVNYKIYGKNAANSVNSHSYLNIVRPCNTYDSDDLNLCDGDFYWIFPTSGGPVGSDGQIQMHRETPVIVKSSSLRQCESEPSEETEQPVLQKIKEAITECFNDLVNWVMNRI